MPPPSYAALVRAANPFKPPSAHVDHIVIGGGVVGLAIAAGLVNTAGRLRSTYLIERRDQLAKLRGHSLGLKSQLCVRGRQLLYDRCSSLNIAHRKTQKLIVATDKYQIPYLDSLQTLSAHPSFRIPQDPKDPYASDSIIPAYFLSGDEARGLEPDLSNDVCAALLVTETGIVDSQGLVDSLAREIEEEDYLGSVSGVGMSGKRSERGEGVIVLGTRVLRIDKDSKDGWVIQMQTGEGEDGVIESVGAKVVVNAAGLNAASLLEGVVPEQELVGMWLAKGNYMSYKGPGVSNVSRLIYPCPGGGLDHLGTHLTMDLDGNIRFGPDVEHIGDAEASRTNPDYWQDHLAPSDSRIQSIGMSVQSYLPGIDPALLTPDYAGFRPNISPPGSPFTDFMIRHHPDRRGLVEVLGFASPGLTSSLATGEYVAAMVRREVWGMGRTPDDMALGWE